MNRNDNSKSRTRINQLPDTDDSAAERTLSEEELRLVSGGRASIITASTCGDGPWHDGVDYDD